MKNIIQYFYGLTPKKIFQTEKTYKFEIGNNKYMLCTCERNRDEINEIYNLYLQINYIGKYCHKIMLNINNEIISPINNNNFVLLKIDIEKRKINIADIIELSNIQINNYKFNKIVRRDWKELWIKKIDYLEYQIGQFKSKYKLVYESSDYYIGIVENCIQLANLQKNMRKGIVHNRINKNATTEDFYNPLNFIIDNRIRDICEYIKTNINEDINIIEIVKKYIYISNLNKDEIELFFARILYPSSYIDKCEKIINNKYEEKIINNVINDAETTEKNIKKIYGYLKTIHYIHDIEWLKKKSFNLH